MEVQRVTKLGVWTAHIVGSLWPSSWSMISTTFWLSLALSQQKIMQSTLFKLLVVSLRLDLQWTYCCLKQSM